MMSYRVCNLIVRSNVPLPELSDANGKDPDCAFQLHAAQRPSPVSCHWFHHWRLPDGQIWLSFAKPGSDYLLRFPDLADFIVSVDGKDIRCYPSPGTPIDTMRHLLLDQVIPLLLPMRGRPVLHASAVVSPWGAIAFIGTTGQGKSTLAGSLCQKGFPLLTDDYLLLEEKEGTLFGIPSYPGLRMWPDTLSALFGQQPVLFRVAHYTEKKRMGLDNGPLPFCPDPVPLSRVYVLVPHEEMGDKRAITITPFSPRDAFMELVQSSYRLDITDRKRLREEFESLARWAALPLFCSLAFPRRLNLLPQVKEAILEDLDSRQVSQ